MSPGDANKRQKMVLDPNTMKLPNFYEEFNEGAKKAFDDNAQAMIESLLYAKKPPNLKRSQHGDTRECHL